MPIRVLSSMLAVLIVTGCAVAQPAKPDEDHSAHYPPGAAPAAAVAQPVPAGAPSTQAYERQMEAMQAMHLKMQAAKTPAERAVLMSEHMKLMRAGLSMMGAMGGMSGMSGMSGPGSQSPRSAVGMMPSPGTAAGPTAAPGASGPGMQGMGGMMKMHTQMERRMAMMEQMMQMMVDREAAMPSN